MLKIKAEELFFLGKYMNAQYIDYDYVCIMEDIQQNYRQQEKNSIDGLVDKGVLTEDFSGNLEMEDEFVGLFRPVFFGDFESVMSHFYVKDQNIEKQSEYRFHFLDGMSTAVEMTGRILNLYNDTDHIMDELFQSLTRDSRDLSHERNPQRYLPSDMEYIPASEIEPPADRRVAHRKTPTVLRNSHGITEAIPIDSICPEDDQDNSPDIKITDLDQALIEEILVLRNVKMNEHEYIGEFFRIKGLWYFVQSETDARSLLRDEFRGIWYGILKGDTDGL